MTENRGYWRRGSLVWPVVLIGLGIVFLLNNLGILDLDIWTMLSRLWPLLLVAVGLDILLGRRAGVWPAVTLAIIIGLFAAGAWMVRSTSMVFSGEKHTRPFSQSLENAEDAHVEINFGLGELRIGEMNSEDELAIGSLDLTDAEQFYQNYDVVGGTGYLSLDSQGSQFYPSWVFSDDGRDNIRTWSIDLNRNVPINLDINTGVGQSVIDLEDLDLTGLSIDTGVGETIVYLPDDGDYEARISGGVGALRVNVPETLAIKITVSTGLGNNSVIGDFDQDGSSYYSKNYDSAADHVTLYVSGGIGEVLVVQVGR